MLLRTRDFPTALCLFLGISAVQLVSGQAALRTSTASPSADDKVTLEKFVVTGTLIPVAAGSTTIPLTTLRAAEMERIGVSTDLIDVIRKSQPAFFGANNLGSDVANTNSFDTNGGSGLSLRNRSTLVLINGRRAAISPVLATEGKSFVDVSVIPLSGIERIEILSDGASATYGSDAVSGVVNIIMKSNFSGVEIGGSYGFSTNPEHWSNRSYYAIAGVKSGDSSITVSTEWKKSDPLVQIERPYSSGLFRTPTFAGAINIGNDFYYLTPSLNAPPRNLDVTPAQAVSQGIYQGPLTQGAVMQFLDIALYPTLLAKAERRSFTAAIERQLSPTTTLFGDFIYSLNESESVLNATPVSGTVAADSPLNPFNVAVTARNRFLTYPRFYANESSSMHGVLGLKGAFGEGWTYDLAGNFNKSIHHFRNVNLIDAAKYNELVALGTYNPFARQQAPGIVESMLGAQVRDYESSLRMFEARVAGPVFNLPGGPVQVGLGASFTWETLDFTNDRNDQTGGWLLGTPTLPFHARKNIDGYFAEARIPVVSERNTVRGAHVLELSVAARHDKYSNTDDSLVPKYSVRWLPFNDELALRATYSESFVAPTVYDLNGPLAIGATPQINITRYNAAGNSLGVQSGPRQYRSQSGSNPTLDPSESRNWTAGVIWSPKSIRGFSVSADWFSIDERNLIDTVPIGLIVADVEQKGTRSEFANRVRLATSVTGETHFADGAPITASGQLTDRPSDEVWISNSKVNVAGAWQDGFDFKVAYNYDTAGWGRVNTTVAGTYLRKYVFQALPTTQPTEYQDAYFSRGNGAGREGVFARYRLYSRIDWSLRNWTVGVAHTYIPSLDDLASTPSFRVANYSSFDAQLGYTFSNSTFQRLRGLQVAAGVNNVSNKFPPLIPSEGLQSHDINAYDPIGRFLYIQLKYKF